MEPYTQEGLQRKEKEKEQQDTDAQVIDEEEREREKYRKYPKEYYEYKISGIVVHTGTSDSGHYYSFAKDRENKSSVSDAQRWYEFNDTLVSEFDPEDIASECYGGEEKWGGNFYSSMTPMKYEKMRNGYLLFYERISPFDAPESDDDEVTEEVE